MLDASSIQVVLEVYRPERSALLGLLDRLNPGAWGRPTECPEYLVKGVATHILGDDLSLLSRQRDGAEQGLSLLGPELPDADFRTLLNTFNDRWVAAGRFLSGELLIELLRLAGEWTVEYYEGVDPRAPGESVGIFGAREGEGSPFWQAIAREYFERWIHHSQIRRALGLSSLADRQFLMPGVEVVAAIARMEPGIPTSLDGPWAVGPVVLGPAEQAAAILTRAHTAEEVRELASGPSDLVQLLAARLGRP
ncbi:MAG: maleylpyruvate isomerase family mycothiol-dependent enzyme [Thaumarchaeota archaeon]|nr:maleylpyruvate isomerase family mycothiol-dependent enzyme [Nitrososphaerota archaeon]